MMCSLAKTPRQFQQRKLELFNVFIPQLLYIDEKFVSLNLKDLNYL
uniref:Uncharacterized protein n=1 Tax=Arundo donax TaxID=35708 RepID=A0A0A8ZRB6_ARUDO